MHAHTHICHVFPYYINHYWENMRNWYHSPPDKGNQMLRRQKDGAGGYFSL